MDEFVPVFQAPQMEKEDYVRSIATELLLSMLSKLQPKEFIEIREELTVSCISAAKQLWTESRDQAAVLSIKDQENSEDSVTSLA